MVGKTNNKLCPVIALLAYLALWGNGPGFLLPFRDGKLLTEWKQFRTEVSVYYRESGRLSGVVVKRGSTVGGLG